MLSVCSVEESDSEEGGRGGDEGGGSFFGFGNASGGGDDDVLEGVGIGSPNVDGDINSVSEQETPFSDFFFGCLGQPGFNDGVVVGGEFHSLNLGLPFGG